MPFSLRGLAFTERELKVNIVEGGGDQRIPHDESKSLRHEIYGWGLLFNFTSEFRSLMDLQRKMRYLCGKNWTALTIPHDAFASELFKWGIFSLAQLKWNIIARLANASAWLIRIKFQTNNNKNKKANPTRDRCLVAFIAFCDSKIAFHDY